MKVYSDKTCWQYAQFLKQQSMSKETVSRKKRGKKVQEMILVKLSTVVERVEALLYSCFKYGLTLSELFLFRASTLIEM